MRHSLLISSALLLALPCGDLSWRPFADGTPAPRARRAELLCQDDAAVHRGAASVEDEAIHRRLIGEGARLIEAGEATPVSLLIPQLERPLAAVEMPLVTPVARRSADLVAAAKESVVVVSGLYRCRRCERWHAGTASGFVIAANGVVVTNHHVVNDPDFRAIVVMTADGRVWPVREVLAASRAHDLAVIKIPAEDLRPLSVAPAQTAAPVGSAVTVISHPDGQYYCCTSGIVSRYARTRANGDIVEEVAITADYARGSSGAPVLNDLGQVIGIVKSTESIYYSESAQQQRDLQMVFKKCVPAQSLRRLVKPSAGPPPGATAGRQRTAGWDAGQTISPLSRLSSAAR